MARASMIATSSHQALCELITDVRLADVPEAARARLALALADMAAVCAGGRPAPAAAIAAEYARAVHPAAEATLLPGDRRAGAV
jgi:hypothetical protein